MSDFDSRLREEMAPLRQIPLHGSIVERVMQNLDQADPAEMTFREGLQLEAHQRDGLRLWVLGFAAVCGVLSSLPGLLSLLEIFSESVTTFVGALVAGLGAVEISTALPALDNIGWLVLAGTVFSLWTLIEVES